MEKWQERVVEEKKELDDKIVKLSKFIESAEFKKEIKDHNLIRQCVFMEAYAGILLTRIAGFE